MTRSARQASTPARIAIAAESGADVRMIQEQVERLAQARRGRFGTPGPKPQIAWGQDQRQDWVSLHHVPGLARELGIPLRGDFDNADDALETGLYRAALLIFALTEPAADAVILSRDLDGEPRRQAGVARAIAERPWPFAVVAALPQPEIEAWLLVAWHPDSAGAHARHQAVCRRIGFDPLDAPERLTSTSRTSHRDAKQILHELQGTPRPPRRLPAPTHLRDLPESWTRCGLTAWLRDACRVLVPLALGLPPGSDPDPD
jgi:hypothetical protein